MPPITAPRDRPGRGAYRGKPVLSAQQVEDVVAWLATLKEVKK
jgi:hypothetical protein